MPRAGIKPESWQWEAQMLTTVHPDTPKVTLMKNF